VGQIKPACGAVTVFVSLPDCIVLKSGIPPGIPPSMLGTEYDPTATIKQSACTPAAKRRKEKQITDKQVIINNHSHHNQNHNNLPG
jgi:hypothetical protein